MRGEIVGTKTGPKRGRAATAIAHGNWRRNFAAKASRFWRAYAKNFPPRLSLDLQRGTKAETERNRLNTSMYHDMLICYLILA